MRIAVFGAGALGCFFGARLQRAGEDVVFIARGTMLQALRAQGLRVESTLLGGLAQSPVRATDNPAEVGPVDGVLLTTKAHDLETTAEAMRPLIGPGTWVLPVLNGVEIAERIGAVLGMEHLLGGMTYVAAGIAAPGVVRHLANNAITLGEPSGGRSKRAEAVAALFERAGITATVSEDIQRDLWMKLMMFAANGGVLAAARSPMGPVLGDPDTRALYIAVVREVEAVARRRGVNLPPDAAEQVLAIADGFPGPTESSMLRDIKAGKRLELEPVHGAIVRLGRLLGVPTPVCGFVYAVLKLHARGREKA